MRTFTSHDQRVAFVEALCDLFWRGYEGDPLDMAERAMMTPTQMWFYNAGKTAWIREFA